MTDPPGLISVRTQVVREVLVNRIVEAILGRYPGEPPAGLLSMPVAAEGPARVTEPLLRCGWLLREVERDMFEPARRPAAWLRERLDGVRSGGQPVEPPFATVSRELALAEPLELPAPADTRAATWRIPGPGGHVRHYVAEAAIELQIGAGAKAKRSGPQSLKRVFLMGFFACCCEELNGSIRPP